MNDSGYKRGITIKKEKKNQRHTGTQVWKPTSESLPNICLRDRGKGSSKFTAGGTCFFRQLYRKCWRFDSLFCSFVADQRGEMSEFAEYLWGMDQVKRDMESELTCSDRQPSAAMTTFKELILSRPDVGNVLLYYSFAVDATIPA